MWAEEPPAILSVPARMPLYSAEWGTLTIQPPMLVFVSDAADTFGVGTQAWPLASFAGADDDEEERARCELRLLQGEDDGLLFGFKDDLSLVQFETSLRTTAISARSATVAAAATATTAAKTAAETAAAETAAAGSSSNNAAGCTQDAASAASASASKRQRTETARVRHGRELREALGRVATLLAHDKSKQAKTAFEAIDQGPAAKDGLAKVRANELRQLLFTFGGFNLTKGLTRSIPRDARGQAAARRGPAQVATGDGRCKDGDGNAAGRKALPQRDAQGQGSSV